MNIVRTTAVPVTQVLEDVAHEQGLTMLVHQFENGSYQCQFEGVDFKFEGKPFDAIRANGSTEENAFREMARKLQNKVMRNKNTGVLFTWPAKLITREERNKEDLKVHLKAIQDCQ